MFLTRPPPITAQHTEWGTEGHVGVENGRMGGGNGKDGVDNGS